jgi:tetratricopeptide (TPR) repeat protein
MEINEAFEILGLSKNSDYNEIKEKYLSLQLDLQHRIENTSNTNLKETFSVNLKRINEAYQIAIHTAPQPEISVSVYETNQEEEFQPPKTITEAFRYFNLSSTDDLIRAELAYKNTLLALTKSLNDSRDNNKIKTLKEKEIEYCELAWLLIVKFHNEKKVTEANFNKKQSSEFLAKFVRFGIPILFILVMGWIFLWEEKTSTEPVFISEKDSFETLFTKGDLRFEKEEYEEALVYFEAALLREPDHPMISAYIDSCNYFLFGKKITSSKEKKSTESDTRPTPIADNTSKGSTNSNPLNSDSKIEQLKQQYAGRFTKMENLYRFVNPSNGSVLYTDELGELINSTKFQDGRNLKNGLIAVKTNNLWGFMNKDGVVVINFQYSNAGDFDQTGHAYVILGKESIKINKQGIRVDLKTNQESVKTEQPKNPNNLKDSDPISIVDTTKQKSIEVPTTNEKSSPIENGKKEKKKKRN